MSSPKPARVSCRSCMSWSSASCIASGTCRSHSSAWDEIQIIEIEPVAVVVVQPPWRSRETYGTVQSCGSLCLAAGGVTLMRSWLSTSFIRREQREGINVVFRIAQVQSVDDHVDVGAALPAHPALGMSTRPIP
jgi:hypothetical protein